MGSHRIVARSSLSLSHPQYARRRRAPAVQSRAALATPPIPARARVDPLLKRLVARHAHPRRIQSRIVRDVRRGDCGVRELRGHERAAGAVRRAPRRQRRHETAMAARTVARPPRAVPHSRAPGIGAVTTPPPHLRLRATRYGDTVAGVLSGSPGTSRHSLNNSAPRNSFKGSAAHSARLVPLTHGMLTFLTTTARAKYIHEAHPFGTDRYFRFFARYGTLAYLQEYADAHHVRVRHHLQQPTAVS